MKFTGTLQAGSNQLTVSYKQPLDAETYWHSHYFDAIFGHDRSEKFILGYLLYPLKGWKLSEAFSLEINVKWALPKSSWLGDLHLRDSREIRCGRWNHADVTVVKPYTEENFEHLTFRYDKNFPDYFGCPAVALEAREDFDGDRAAFSAAARSAQNPSNL